MILKVTRNGSTVRTIQPRDGNGAWRAAASVNEHPAHKGAESGDLTAEALGFLRESGRVNAWLSRFLPSQTGVEVGNGKGTANGRREPVADLPGVSLKVRELLPKGGKRSSKLTTLREASARGLFSDLAALHTAGRDLPVVTLLLPRVGDAYILAEEEISFHVSYPFREFARTGWDASIGRGRGTVGRPPKGAILPETWMSHDAGTDCKGGSWLWYGAHPRTHTPGEWSKGTLAEVHAIIAGLMYE